MRINQCPDFDTNLMAAVFASTHSIFNAILVVFAPRTHFFTMKKGGKHGQPLVFSTFLANVHTPVGCNWLYHREKLVQGEENIFCPKNKLFIASYGNYISDKLWRNLNLNLW